MPAINVAKSDTFEIQRQKINDIGSILSNISAGGSDLQTGNLKLGDGSKGVPSLAFISDASLGLYRSDNQEMSWVSGGKNLITFSTDKINSFQNFNVRKRSLLQSGIEIKESGENYDTGTYTGIDLLQGSGSFATANLTVEAYEGTVTNVGSNYLSGSYSDIPLETTGSGTDIIVEFSTIDPVFSVTNTGSGYVDGEWSSIPVTSSGNGSGLQLNLVITGGSIDVAEFSISEAGFGHLASDTFTISNADIQYEDSEGVLFDNTGSGIQVSITNNPNTINPESLVFTDKGEGTEVGDVFNTPGGGITKSSDLPGRVEGLTTTLGASATITVSSTAGIIAGMIVTQSGGDGSIASDTTIQSVTNATTLVLSEIPEVTGTATLDISSESTTSITFSSVAGLVNGSLISGGGYSGVITDISTEENNVTIDPESTSGSENVTFTIDPPYGSGSGFEFTIDTKGVITEVNVNSAGTGYAVGDILEVRPSDVTQPITVFVNTRDLQKISVASGINVSVGSVINSYTPADPEAGTSIVYGADITVAEITGGSPGNATEFIATVEEDLGSGAEFVINSSGPVYTVVDQNSEFRYLVGFDENSLTETPTITLYANSKYFFSQTDGSRDAHPLALSTALNGPLNQVTGITSTLSTASPIISVSNSTGISVGMIVTVDSGDGELSLGSNVVAVNGTSITLSENPNAGGAVTLIFTGAEYTDGVVSNSEGLTVSITETTPNPLFYYCANHLNVGGQITTDPNNPKVFGSNFELLVTDIQVTDVINANVDTGLLDAVSITTTGLTSGTIEGTTSITSPAATLDLVTTNSIESTASTDLSISSSSDINLQAVNVNAGNVIINTSSSTIEAFGSIKTETNFNVNDIMTLANNNISTNPTNNLLLTPGLGRVAKVDTNTALIIPVGNNSERPATGIVGDGAIRFNTETNQYEGYSATNSQWSSLGGVRDLDGNTTILAEEFVGANDNTLWFINDNINTLRVTRNHLEFVNAKKIKSVNIAAPDFSKWTANTPVTAGDYLKYRNNIYEVVVSGTTGTSGNEPTDTSGNAFSNGSSQLTYFTTAVSTLTFEEISEVQIDPLGFTDLVVNNEIRFSGNTISSTSQDIIISPTGSQKVEIDGTSSLVLPVGDSNSKGNPVQGSVRYNTTDSQFEGYNGAQWGGLGGVKDIDQDTKITAETAPGADEDILYFFNESNNTLRLSTTQLVFDTINTIQSVDGTFAIDASSVTFDSGNTTIDNTDSNSSHISSIKDNLDFGISTGIFNDHLLRLTDTGTLVFNLGFSTGTPNNLTVLNNNLTNFELLHTRLNTFKLNLVKGTTNFANALIYAKSTELSAKIIMTAFNTTTGDKEIVEYSVLDDGTDVIFSDFNNFKTGAELVAANFDIDSIGNVRINISLDTNLTNGDSIQVTLVNTITKR
jgi:hypothetical protein